MCRAAGSEMSEGALRSGWWSPVRVGPRFRHPRRFGHVLVNGLPGRPLRELPQMRALLLRDRSKLWQ